MMKTLTFAAAVALFATSASAGSNDLSMDTEINKVNARIGLIADDAGTLASQDTAINEVNARIGLIADDAGTFGNQDTAINDAIARIEQVAADNE